MNKAKELLYWMLEMDKKYAIMSDARADKVITETAEYFYGLGLKDGYDRGMYDEQHPFDK